MQTFVHWPFFPVFWHPRHWPWLQSIPPWRCWPSSPLVSSFLLVGLDTWTMIIVIFVYLCHVMIPWAPRKNCISCHRQATHRIFEILSLGGSDGRVRISKVEMVQPCSAFFEWFSHVPRVFVVLPWILALFLFTQDLACGLRRIVDWIGESGEVTILPPKNWIQDVRKESRPPQEKTKVVVSNFFYFYP